MIRVINKLATNSAEIESEDLLLEILIRLPLYSIQRLKTACKQWQSLINNPIFRKQWRKRNLKPSIAIGLVSQCALYLDYLYPLSPNKLTDVQPLRTDLVVMQSCNGLLLCRKKKTESSYHVYNPTNNTCHFLPELELGGISEGYIEAMNLAFDPNRFLHYKVICCVNFDNNELRVYIYSSDTGTWMLVSRLFRGTIVNYELFDTRPLWKPVSNNFCETIVNNKGVYWNGAINWVKKLTYFDIENESFKAMPKPPDDGDDFRICYYAGESCDRFNYVPLLQPQSANSCSRVHVYELRMDYSEWVFKYHVELDYLYRDSLVLSVVHSVDGDDSFLLLETPEGIVRLNIVSKTSEQVLVSFIGGYMHRAFHYIESQYCV